MALKLLVGAWPVVLAAPLVLAASACTYTLTAHLSGVGESRLILDPIRRVLGSIQNNPE